MGYTTEFEGRIAITPPLEPSQVAKVNAFCEERHAGAVQPHAGCPGIWCDYHVSEDGASIGWNGSEKSYEMDAWLPYLIEKFFRPWGRTLNGMMEAQGEDRHDRWALKVEDNKCRVLRGSRVTYEE
jgi:hypothetical protein